MSYQTFRQILQAESKGRRYIQVGLAPTNTAFSIPCKTPLHSYKQSLFKSKVLNNEWICWGSFLCIWSLSPLTEPILAEHVISSVSSSHLPISAVFICSVPSWELIVTSQQLKVNNEKLSEITGAKKARPQRYKMRPIFKTFIQAVGMCLLYLDF